MYVDADLASRPLTVDDQFRVRHFSWLRCLYFGFLGRRNAFHSQSASEAEYLAMGDGVKEAVFMNGMLQFPRPSAKPRTIDALKDNEGTITIAENSLSSIK